MKFGNITNTTDRFSLKQYNLFYTVQKHEIYPFMESVSYEFHQKHSRQWSASSQ